MDSVRNVANVDKGQKCGWRCTMGMDSLGAIQYQSFPVKTKKWHFTRMTSTVLLKIPETLRASNRVSI